jgi:hypothetical protein
VATGLCGAPLEIPPEFGPVSVRVRLPDAAGLHWEPLLASGIPGEGDVLFVRRIDSAHVIFGWERIGMEAVLSAPVPAMSAMEEDLLLSLGSMIPPDAEGPLAVLRSRVLVQLGGRLVLLSAAAFSDEAVPVILGGNPVGGSLAPFVLSGKMGTPRRASDDAVANVATVASYPAIPQQLIRFSMMYRGLPRISSNARHRYSPSTPSIMSCTPETMSTTHMSEAQPSTGLPSAIARAATTRAYTNPVSAKTIPQPDMSRMGK